MHARYNQQYESRGKYIHDRVKFFPYLQRYYFPESYELVVPPNSKDEKPEYVHIEHKQVSIFKVLSFYAYSSANTSHCSNDPFVFPCLGEKW